MHLLIFSAHTNRLRVVIFYIDPHCRDHYHASLLTFAHINISNINTTWFQRVSVSVLLWLEVMGQNQYTTIQGGNVVDDWE